MPRNASTPTAHTKKHPDRCPYCARWVTVDVAAGSRSYVKVNQKIDDVKFGGGLTVMQSVEIEEMSAEDGQKELAEGSLLGEVDFFHNCGVLSD